MFSIVSEEKFVKRLFKQITDGVHRNFISILKDLYHTNELAFIGLSLLSISGFLMIISMIVSAILLSFQKDNQSYSYLMNTVAPFFLFLFCLMAAGLVFLMGERFVTPRAPRIFSAPQMNHNSSNENLLSNRKIFVVHGHDSDLKRDVELFLRTLDLDPIILHQQASRNKTIIEKVEYYSDVSFAVILLTADDIGSEAGLGSATDANGWYALAIDSDYLSGMKVTFSEFLTEEFIIVKDNKQTLVEVRDLFKELKLRARQNVLFECGYFIGKLERGNVAILCDPIIEIATDLQGLCYIVIDYRGAWRKELAKEINAAGIIIDEKRINLYEGMKSYLSENGLKTLSITYKMDMAYAQELVRKKIQTFSPEFINDMKNVGFMDSDNQITDIGKTFLDTEVINYILKDSARQNP